MTTFDELEHTELTNEEFWEVFVQLVIETGPGIQDHNETIRSLLTAERCLDVNARFAAMTDEEVAWMGAKRRWGKPIRVYRAAAIGNISSFRFHTNMDHALADLPEDTYRAHLLTGEIDVDSVIFRIEQDGCRLVIASPDRVRALKVQELVHPDVYKPEEDGDVEPWAYVAEMEDRIDDIEEGVEDQHDADEETEASDVDTSGAA